jgi:tRNA dimethylallyltransferase
MSSNLILILGVTASGKSRLAFDLAKALDGEIISIDSMKVYRRMDIGTAKPSAEARAQIRYHLLDVVEPTESFSVASFLDLANHAVEQIKNRNKPVIGVGGTALYIKALLYGLFEGPSSDEKIRGELKQLAEKSGLQNLYHQLQQIDPAATERIHPNDSKRIIRALEVFHLTGKPISTFQKQWEQNSSEKHKPQCSTTGKIDEWTIIGLRREKELESKRINSRVKKMLDDGLVDEVKSLLSEEKPLSEQARCAIGYAEIINYINGKTKLDEAIELIKKNTRRLAKGQRTWFKTFKNVNWLDIEPEESPEQLLAKVKELTDSSK